MKKNLVFLTMTLFAMSCSTNEDKKSRLNTSETLKEHTLIANIALERPKIDGDSSDACWSHQTWYPISYTWMGKPYTKEDFEGRFKLSWTKEKLYLLAEIKDDSLVDKYSAWNDNWWNDDCIEIFIDENNGDEEHQFNYNAFAYHVALNTKDVVDLGTDSMPHLYNDHILTAKKTSGKISVWEFAIDIYDDSFVFENSNNNKVTLSKDKTMGFCLNYCDNDTSETRENFISSIPVEGTTDEERDLGWKEARVFNDLILR